MLKSEETFVLMLTREQAEVLHFVCASVAGDPDGPRGVTNIIYEALNEHFSDRKPLHVEYEGATHRCVRNLRIMKVTKSCAD